MAAVKHAPVQMLWVGGPLSVLERLALRSWLANGHDVHLYTYGKPMKAPAGSPLTQDCLDSARAAANAGGNATTGPLLLHGAIEKFHMTTFLLNPHLFCPLPFWEMPTLIAGTTLFPPDSYGVHLWHESWRRNFFDKNASYDSLSLVERLKAHYLGRREGSHA